METIGKREIRALLSEYDTPTHATNNQIRNDKGHRVHSFLALAQKIADLQFNNPQYVFLFRGQSKDYMNKFNNSSLKPSLFRPEHGEIRPPSNAVLSQRFQLLAEAERLLVDRYGQIKEFRGDIKLKRQRILRWSILQHYEICYTPLLDVTQSLRVAGSFASEPLADQSFIYVLGVPQLSGSLTASSEAGLQIVRLAGVCPPVALRPHIQEGYLLGEYPDMPDFNQKQHYKAFEIDFGRRLLAKFVFDPKTFWQSEDFPKINRSALYPNADDPLYEMAMQLKIQLGPQE